MAVMDIRLDGRVALITGATGGIGSAIATEFFKSGATVVLNGRSQEKIEALTDKLLTGGDKKDAMKWRKSFDLEKKIPLSS